MTEEILGTTKNVQNIWNFPTDFMGRCGMILSEFEVSRKSKKNSATLIKYDSEFGWSKT